MLARWWVRTVVLARWCVRTEDRWCLARLSVRTAVPGRLVGEDQVVWLEVVW